MVIATALVIVLTYGAKALGPQLSGLLAPFPAFTAILTVFAHRSHGVRAARTLLRGVLLGSFAFACFYVIVAALLEHVALGVTFVLAGVAAGCVNLLILLQQARAKAT